MAEAQPAAAGGIGITGELRQRILEHATENWTDFKANATDEQKAAFAERKHRMAHDPAYSAPIFA